MDKNCIPSIFFDLIKGIVSLCKKISGFSCTFDAGDDATTTNCQMTNFRRLVDDPQQSDFGPYLFQHPDEIIAAR